MVLKHLKLQQFLMVWHEIFPTHKQGHQKRSWNFIFLAKKGVFLVLSGKKQISTNVWRSFNV